MRQFYGPEADSLLRGALLLALIFVISVFGIIAAVGGSAYVTRQGTPRNQPVPFSHEHHVGGLGIDCRYCHTTVEYSSFANIPATKICMNCHSELWTSSEMLEPVRRSWITGKSIPWVRVHDLPGFVYFHHGVHVQKGIGCEECHGRVDRMPLMWQYAPLTMSWCLDCHRHPENHVRPKSEVVTMGWRPPSDRRALGLRLVKEYQIESLTSCSTCHR